MLYDVSPGGSFQYANVLVHSIYQLAPDGEVWMLHKYLFTRQDLQERTTWRKFLQARMVSEYNATMAAKMGWSSTRSGLNPFEYHPERGIYYHYLTSDLLLGSQPRSPGDVAHLAKDEGVDAILNLQQDRDLRHWGVDLASLRHAASEHGVQYMRAPAVDFDPGSLRHALPTAVGMLLEALSQGRRVFVHCTAGLGRAPAACIAAIYWAGLGVLPARDGLVRLEDAYKYVTDIRPCGPNQDAIRGATGDLLLGHSAGDLQPRGAQAFATLSVGDREIIVDRLQM
ncbi:hypothetical protein APUTEX25_004080 [Auxenochlorella protothecoides]|uniref:Uncharacterized protein n=1 Tax=Auxenochlorella protothecoides TaxID=3075 RepID=A0A3M7L6Y2_AUXPR|nr:hypothetical protein APUTEX25_004080 [Auxenochlorella protothecoides]|eukprot:RMZ57246.1 hypothetical protein APUTEX25_004080 [Auxenochlorella protothecoides]